jgi:nitrogen regulatory protein P-II 1
MKKIEKSKRTSRADDVKNELKQIGIEFFSYWEAAVASHECIDNNNTFRGNLMDPQYIQIQRSFRNRSDKN